jgi:predicted N-acyltransferase
MKITVHDAIAAIDPTRWDALGTDPFSAHGALAALEESSMEGVRMRYAVLEHPHGWVAAAPFARIPIDAGRLTHGLFRRLIGGARRIEPQFMRTTLTICGTPLSVGNPPARIAPRADRAAVYRQLAGLLQEIGREDGSPWTSFKEIGADELAIAREALGPGGWTIAPSETNHELAIRWSCFDGYLADLRSAYRTKLRREGAALARAGVRTTVVPLRESYDDVLHALYTSVVDRAAVELERLTPAFFSAFGRLHRENAVLIRMARGERTVGWVALLVDGNVVYDLFHGIDYETNAETPIYFGQLAEVVRFAIDCGVRRLSLGQSTSAAKVRFGARPRGLWMAVRHENAIVNAALRCGRGVLFPVPKEPERRVFQAPEPVEVLRCSTAS